MIRNGRFIESVNIPKKTLRNVTWKALAPSIRIVFIAMMTQDEEKNKHTGHVKWSEEEIEQESGVSLSTVKRSLKELQRMGLITKCISGGRWHKKTDYLLNEQYTGWI